MNGLPLMRCFSTPLEGVKLIESVMNRDERGSFLRAFCVIEMAELRPNLQFSQINISMTSHRGTIRGLHYQLPPFAESKLIRCARGSVFDVAVDLRRDSPTFLKWHGVELKEDLPVAYFIPEGVAHGFQALSDDAQLLYMHTAPWEINSERRIKFDDPMIGIEWPIISSRVSDKDRLVTYLPSNFDGVLL